jgi:hypothetical protein
VDPNLVYLVRVTTHDGKRCLWAAATSRDEAVGRVLRVFPEGCSARLLDGFLKPRRDVVLAMIPGEVRELVADSEVAL